MSISRLHCNPGRNTVRAGINGFTLIEIMMVLLICVGLVTLMSALYRSVGKSAIALRGGQQEWKMQQQVREQMLHLFTLKSTALPVISGRPTEIYFASWRSGAEALDGKPVLGYCYYAANERALYYREYPLPPWWQGATLAFEPSKLQMEVRAAPSRKILTGVESLAFAYLQKGATGMRPEHWAHEWQDLAAPGLIQLKFTKAGRNYTILFETRATDA